MKVRDRELDKYFQVGPKRRVYSSLAQSVEHAAVNRSVVGSSPTGGVKKQHRSERPVFSSGNANPVRGMSAFTVITWLRGQAVKTSPFHGSNTGSIPVGVISDNVSCLIRYP